jgi:putative oxidoreductase
MAMKQSGLSQFAPYLQSVLRIVAAFTFVAHGTQKLFGVPGFPLHLPALTMSLMSAAGIIETVGGLLMLVGLFSRPVAFLLSGQMAFAFFMQHWPRGFWPVVNGGELAVLYCFLWLFFCAAGPGPWSVDALRRRA